MNLTAREQEVARLAWDGMFDKEIADKLGVQKCTVQKHWENIFKRLEVRQAGGRASRQTVFRRLVADGLLAKE
jgi:DNA-binding NarL/FixJ family response regulator